MFSPQLCSQGPEEYVAPGGQPRLNRAHSVRTRRLLCTYTPEAPRQERRLARTGCWPSAGYRERARAPAGRQSARPQKCRTGNEEGGVWTATAEQPDQVLRRDRRTAVDGSGIHSGRAAHRTHSSLDTGREEERQSPGGFSCCFTPPQPGGLMVPHADTRRKGHILNRKGSIWNTLNLRNPLRPPNGKKEAAPQCPTKGRSSVTS